MKRFSCLMSVIALHSMLWLPVLAAQETDTGAATTAAGEAEPDMVYDPESPMEKGKISGAYEFYRLCAG